MLMRLPLSPLSGQGSLPKLLLPLLLDLPPVRNQLLKPKLAEKTSSR
jgi:hypothetical protein